MVRRLHFRRALGCLALFLMWYGSVAGGRGQQRSATSATSGSTEPTSHGTEFLTPNGQPDLQGRWDFSTVTPWERPAGTPLHLDEGAAREIEQKLVEQGNFDLGTRAGRAPYNQFWTESGERLVRVNGVARASLIVDPPDGRLPPFTADGRKALERVRQVQDLAARAEDRPAQERCILGFNTGPPLTPGNYGNIVEIIQNADYVAVISEHVHSARVFPVDGRPHTGIRQWLGDSVGRWEGDTLVAETINFHNDAGVTHPRLHGNGSGPRVHLIERFRRLDANTILYSFTIDDRDLWTRPWTMEFTLVRADNDPVLEYACHETNYGMANGLSGARALEKNGAAGR